jgi:lipopolysaccharide transport system ATP-binding protein
MNSDIVIRVEGVGKKYRIRHENPERYVALRDVIANSLCSPWRLIASKFKRSRGFVCNGSSRPDVQGINAPFTPPPQEDFWALRGVSFEVRRGEVVGLIGRNGAGKSTLLKILSRITEPTTGEIEIEGRVASLLEVATGFHPELTGRENVFLNGAILGMTRGEIRKKFDEIVAFAEVERFLDTPVKRYSSGMYMRLAFAVAAHLEPEILIVDEVLAVGDAEFQEKCLGKMHAVATCGRTIMFVSHNMQAISLLCDRALLLDRGSIVYEGLVKETIRTYMSRQREASATMDLPDRRPGTGDYRFASAQPTKDHFNSSEPKGITFEIQRQRRAAGTMWLSANIINSAGVTVMQCDSRLVGKLIRDCERYAGHFAFTTPWLKPGEYRVDLFICGGDRVIDSWENACSIIISPLFPYAHSVSTDGISEGLVFADFSWSDRNGARANPLATSSSF